MERKDACISLECRRSCYSYSPTYQERVADNLGLLFNPVALERPPWLQHVIILTQRMPCEWQIPATLSLSLPNVCQFMNEQPLSGIVRS